jgi:ELWxxDGT repeat protein
MSRWSIYFCAAFVLTSTHLYAATDAGGQPVVPVLLKDINPGAASATPSPLVRFNGVLFFEATDATNGSELWRTDGTEAGTVLIKDINPGVADSQPLGFFALNNTLFFVADDGVNGRELWKTDGSAAGTVMVKDINPAPGAGGFPFNFVAAGSTIYFTADDGTTGDEIWKSDGTTAGTVLVKDINPGAATSSPFFIAIANTDGTSATNLHVEKGVSYFRADDGVNGFELWRTDGTDAGTFLLQDITPGAVNQSLTFSLLRFADRLIFEVSDNTVTVGSVWVTDGTMAGTTMLTGPISAFSFSPAAIATVNAQGEVSNPSQFAGKLVFTAQTAASGNELYVSDGTVAGTTLIDINPGATGSVPVDFKNINGKLIFAATSATVGSELFVSDLTAAGTVPLADINPGVGDANPFFLNVRPAPAREFLFFAATDGVNGEELWKTDGTPAGTVLVADINPGTGDSLPGLSGPFQRIGTKYFFDAFNATTGTELYVTDGTAGGTALVKDINPGVADSFPGDIQLLNGVLIFNANTAAEGLNLWRSDGTEPGTALLLDVEPGAASPSGLNLNRIYGKLAIFDVTTTANGTESLLTNGSTGTGTRLIDLNPGASSSAPLGYTPVGSKLLFTATTADNGTELFSYNLVDFAFPPVITSALNRSAAVGTPFTYTLSASGNANLVTTLAVFGLPPGLSFDSTATTKNADGTIVFGKIIGTPTMAGRYSVTLNADNGAGTDIKTLTIVIPGNGTSISGVDSDGDGFSDELETFLGTNPNDGASTPLGGSVGLPVVPTIDKIQILLNFAKQNSDSASVAGTLALADGFNFSGQTITFDIGGVLKTFTLDAKGKAKASNDSVSIGKPKNGVAKFSASFKKGSFASALVDENVIDQTVKNGSATVPLLLLFNSSVFAADQTLTLNAKLGKTLKASKAR